MNEYNQNDSKSKLDWNVLKFEFDFSCFFPLFGLHTSSHFYYLLFFHELPLSSLFWSLRYFMEQVLNAQRNVHWSLCYKDTFQNITKGLTGIYLLNRNERDEEKMKEKSFKKDWMSNWLMCLRHFNGCNKSTERHLIIFLPSFILQQIIMRFLFQIWRQVDLWQAQTKTIQF